MQPNTLYFGDNLQVLRTHFPDACAEDTLLHKLVWFELGRRASDRQWGDILGVLKIQGSWLDHDYLDRWAAALGVGELLGQARRDAP